MNIPSNNILLIDKPAGITSFDVIRILRRRLGIRKMGHAGTLDPIATGLLIIGLNKATKELGRYMGLPKEYEAFVEFGKTSTTYDAAGKLTPRALKIISREDFEAALARFTGRIEQVPPAFSAVHVKGQRAYDLARKGIAVELKPRAVEVYAIEIMEWDWPLARLRIRCSTGTYIRSLAHDLGEKLGCGAYVKELRRTRIGGWSVEDAQVPDCA